MTTVRITTILLVGGAVIAAGAAWAQPQKMPPGCAQIVAVLDASGGGLSADEVAKKTNTDVETVRNCTDLWRATKKDPTAGKAATAGQPSMPPGCAQVVAVLDQGGGSLSADEVAKKSNTDVETVRNCTDLWRRTTKGGKP